MTQTKSITIVGGGLAGLTLGIGLRQLDVPVTIWEAGVYPRHKVCGEFASGRGQQVLRSLQLLELLRSAGAIFSSTARFYLGKTASRARQIQPAALCLSRFAMDEVLARHFCTLGGDLRLNSRWKGERQREGLVVASGRAATPVESGWRWFGLKVHARNVDLDSDLEMHGTSNGYVGLCRLPGDAVNVCGLFRTRPGTSLAPPETLLKGAPGSRLEERLAEAQFDHDSFCSVAGLSLRSRTASKQAICQIGDAITMIPPVTGNGMSIAFESASIALQPLTAYCRGLSNWAATRQAIAQRCDEAFRQRLFWARWAQLFILHPVSRGRFGGLVLNCDLLWNKIFNLTR